MFLILLEKILKFFYLFLNLDVASLLHSSSSLSPMWYSLVIIWVEKNILSVLDSPQVIWWDVQRDSNSEFPEMNLRLSLQFNSENPSVVLWSDVEKV